ncbi:MAG TPA: XrtA/PEP-CTERM system TPR-repeat protein PrsT [Steroidobacteraceae bacterium]
MKGHANTCSQHRPIRTRGVIALCAALVALMGCDVFLSTEQRIGRGEEALQAGDYLTAMEQLKIAVEKEPQNARGRELLARVYLRVGDLESAAKELTRALESGADAAALRPLHYEILLAQGRFGDVLTEAKADKSLTEVQRLLLAANAQASLGQGEEALTSAQQALSLAPQDRDAALQHARALWITGQLQEADNALTALLKQHPDFARAAIEQGRLAFSLGDAKRATEAFENALRVGRNQLNVPEQVMALAGLVESHLALGDVAAAEAAVKRIESRASSEPFISKYLKARVAFARGDYKSATTLLQSALTKAPGHMPAQILLASALFEQGLSEQAEAELTRVLAERPESVEARKLLARIYIARNDMVNAQRIMEKAPQSGERDPQTDWLNASIKLMSGQADEAVALLEQSVRADPDNNALKLELARAQLLAGQSDRALATVREIPEGEGGALRGHLMILAETAGKSAAEARETIARVAAANSKDAPLLVISASYLLRLGDAEGARKLFTNAIDADAKNTDARLGLATIAMQSGNADEAEKRLREVVEINPKSERAYVGLAGIAYGRSDRESARTWLEKAISADPSVVQPRLLLAEMAFADGDTVRGDSLLSQALAVTRTRPATLNHAGEVLLKAGKPQDALKRFDEAEALGLAEAGVNAAMTLANSGRLEEARARLEKIAADRPQWIAPVALLVQLDARDQRISDALARLDRLEKAGAPRAAVEELRGDVQMIARRFTAAVDAYARAAKLRPTATLAIKTYRARKAGSMADPQAPLTQWLKHSPDPNVHVALAEHYQSVGDRRGAIAQYEEAAKVLRSPVIMNNLAWLYHEQADARALPLAREAYEAARQNPAIADTYGWILVETGNVTEGLPVLEAAALAAPNAGDIQYHYAAALARAGKPEQAIQVLHKLLTRSEPFASRRDAEALLKALSS